MDQRDDYADPDPTPLSEWLGAVVFPLLLVVAGVAGLFTAFARLLPSSPDSAWP